MVGIRDVAEICRVSPSTVSRALSGVVICRARDKRESDEGGQ